MNILIVTQYFWPEAFRINDLVLGLKERGNNVAVLTGKPNYPKGKFSRGYSFWSKNKEIWKGIEIFRSPLIPRGKGGGINLIANYFSFAFFASFRGLFIREKFDLIFVFEPSPITVGIPAVLLSKKMNIPLYFWVQDLWPQSVSAAGQIQNKFILYQIDKLTRWIYKNSKRVLIQSEGFREYILKQGVPNDKIIYYPNSSEEFYKPVQAREEIRKLVPFVPFTVMFAGNIGEAQDFETIIEAVRIVQNVNKNIHFVILGDGRKKQFVVNKINELSLQSNFHLLGSFPVNDMPDFFACADVLLVTLKKSEIFALTIPSKVQSYLACSKPIVAALDGEGAKVIEESKAGLISTSGDAKTLAENILLMYDMGKVELEEMSRDARLYFEENFEREKLISRLLSIFNDDKFIDKIES